MRIELSFRDEETPDVKRRSIERHLRVLSTDAWREMKQRVYDIRLAVTGRETQEALTAGAKAMAESVRQFLDAATTSYYRNNYYIVSWRERNWYWGLGDSLYNVIQGRPGKGREYFPSAYLQLGGRGARQAWLVDQGHAGPKPDSPRTPPHPFILQGIDASESTRNEAMLKKYQELFDDMTKRVVAGSRGKSGFSAGEGHSGAIVSS